MARKHYIDPAEQELQKSRDKQMVLDADSSNESSGSSETASSGSDESEVEESVERDMSSPEISDSDPLPQSSLDRAGGDVSMPTSNPSPDGKSTPVVDTQEKPGAESKESEGQTEEDKQENE